jgi:hypothetical protein
VATHGFRRAAGSPLRRGTSKVVACLVSSKRGDDENMIHALDYIHLGTCLNNVGFPWPTCYNYFYYYYYYYYDYYYYYYYDYDYYYYYYYNYYYYYYYYHYYYYYN